MLKAPLYLGFFSLVIAAMTLSSAFVIERFILGVLVTLMVSIAWGIFLWREWVLGSILCMLIFILGISLAAILEGSRLILLISILATLSTWDLTAFHARLATSRDIANQGYLINAHLIRLAYVLIIGLTLPLLTFTFHYELKFWQVFLLGILLLASLSYLFSQLRREG